jgi:ion channel-forming bestrophin family protein
MLESDNKGWLKSTLQIKGSVVPKVIGRSIYIALFGLLISTLYFYKIPVAQPVLGNVIPSIVLALLLVFRTNTAYDRFWEGRSFWGLTSVTISNLTWQIWTAVDDKTTEGRERKIKATRLLPALAIAQKLYLRNEKPNEQLAKWLSAEQYEKLKDINNFPLEITCWIGEALQDEYRRGTLTLSQLTNMQHTIQDYQSSLYGCVRILKTPIPKAYSIHLKQLVAIYCLVLPFQFVKDLGWFTGAFVGFVGFALFGIEEIGLQIENPFGYDPNDLPLDEICLTIEKNVEEFIQNQS